MSTIHKAELYTTQFGVRTEDIHLNPVVDNPTPLLILILFRHGCIHNEY